MKFSIFAAATAFAISGTAAFAQGQNGLVNISVDGNTVQVPVSVAANVCDVAVNVLARNFAGTDQVACTIDQETAAENNIGGGPGQGGGQQRGLVNVSVDGNTVKIPVGVAANVCDVDVNVLAAQFVGTEDTVCTINQETAAENGIAPAN